jgi:methyl-accepting chemotaxis protein
MTILAKLTSFAVFVVLVIICQVGISYYWSYKIDQAALLKDKVLSVTVEAQKMRVAEKAYLQYFDEKLVEDRRKAATIIGSLLEQLASDDSVIEAKRKGMKTVLVEAGDAFSALVASHGESVKIRRDVQVAVEGTLERVNKLSKQLSRKENELQMEGGNLTSEENGVAASAEKASQVVLQFQNGYMQFLTDGNEASLAPCERLLEVEWGAIQNSLKRFAAVTKDKSLIDQEVDISKAVGQLKTIPKLTKSAFAKERKNIQTLDEKGLEIMRLGGEMSAAVDQNNLSTRKVTFAVAAIVSLGAILISVVFGYTMVRSIIGPVNRTVMVVKQVAAGDMTQRIDMTGRDELGQLAQSMNEMAENLRGIMKELSEKSMTLSAASEELSVNSTQMAQSAEAMSGQSRAVTSAGQDLSANMATMTSSAKHVSTSASDVAQAIEQMNASVAEVARNCAKETEIARHAHNQAGEARAIMGKLNDSAMEIGKVVGVISGIAEQTNLLALNATIEAASAGEAGKGFAVVANEVKELARQSAQATKQISRQIEEMQGNTQVAVKAIGEIAGVVDHINQISGTIAAAVEEQSATTHEIAKTVSGVSAATNDMAKSIQDSARGADEVSCNIQGVNTASQQVAEGAAQNNRSAIDLAHIAARLQAIVTKFKT